MVLAYSEILNKLGTAAKQLGLCTTVTRLVQWIGRPRTVQGVLACIVIGIWLSLTLTIFLTLAVSKTEIPTLWKPIPDHLLPGLPLPKGASCYSGDGGSRPIEYCEVFQKGWGLVYLTYDQRTQVIRSAGLTDNTDAIGDAIVAWGRPDSFRYANGTFQIYWGKRSAFVWTPLKPNSPIRVIHYELESADLPQDRLVWRGFITPPSEVTQEQQ
jgi:hypothetical protein